MKLLCRIFRHYPRFIYYGWQWDGKEPNRRRFRLQQCYWCKMVMRSEYNIWEEPVPSL